MYIHILKCLKTLTKLLIVVAVRILVMYLFQKRLKTLTKVLKVVAVRIIIMHLHQKISTMYFYILLQNILLLLMLDLVKVRDRFCGICRFMQAFVLYKYNVKTCMYTKSTLYNMMNQCKYIAVKSNLII